MASLWINGRLCDENDAVVSVFDHGLTTGDGVFETLRLYQGVPFAIRRHLERLQRSAQGLGLELPPLESLREAMLQVARSSRLRDGRLRLTATGGVAPLGSDRSPGPATVIIAVGELAQPRPTERIVTAPWVRNERGALAGLKSTSYGENVRALAHAKALGAGEAMLGNSVGELCEGTGTNIFVVVDDQLLTPPLASGCLAGVTRGLVLELTGAREQSLPLSALAEATELFLTSSTREVQPVAFADEREVALAPGPHTRAAQAAFAELVARDLDP